jgi:Proton-conducting membrane transporter
LATLLLIYVQDFKRLFAFSTVEHMGFILLAAGLGGADAHLGAALPRDSKVGRKGRRKDAPSPSIRRWFSSGASTLSRQALVRSLGLGI